LKVFDKGDFPHFARGKFPYDARHRGKTGKSRRAETPFARDYDVSVAASQNYQRLDNAESLNRRRKFFQSGFVKNFTRLIRVGVDKGNIDVHYFAGYGGFAFFRNRFFFLHIAEQGSKTFSDTFV